MLANLLANISHYLIIEFIDRQDSWVSKMISDMRYNSVFFDFYNKDNFEKEFGKYFSFVETKKIKSSYRTLYLMKSRQLST